MNYEEVNDLIDYVLLEGNSICLQSTSKIVNIHINDDYIYIYTWFHFMLIHKFS